MTDIEKINELVGEKEFSQAKPLIEEALKESPDNIELLKLGGLTDVNLENWFDARNKFETVIKYDIEDATSWFYLANCYEKLGETIEAKNAYIKVIELRPEYVKAYKNLCILLLKTDTPTEAVKYAQAASLIDNQDYIYDFIIGTAHMKAKEYEQALEPLKKAHEKMPLDISMINSLGTCYMSLGKFPEAINTYERAIEICPDMPMAYYNIGSAYQILKNHEKACEYLKKAIELENDETFISALAMSQIKLGKYKEALEQYKQLAVMHPTKENYKYNIVTCYEALGDYNTAINMLERMVFLNPKFIVPAQKLANLYIKTNQYIKAKDIYDKILLKNNLTAETMHQYAILSSELCDTDTAERMLKKVIKINPGIAKAHKDLGIIYLNKRLFDYAEDEFKTAMKLAPNDYEIVFEYANYLYATSQNAEAERFYAEAIELNPQNTLALTFMALNKLVLNKLDEAKHYIFEALKCNSSNEYVQFCAGRILYACGEYEDAKTYLIKAVEQNPDVETQNTLALTYFALKDYSQALNIFKNIYEKHPKSISVMMDIAKCYEALTENDNALDYLNRVVDIFPENEEAHKMIRKLS